PEDIARFLGITQDEAENLDVTKFTLTVKNINRLEESDLNQEFFDKIFPAGDVTSEEQFNAKVKEELENLFKQNSAQKLRNDMYTFGMDSVEAKFPEEYISLRNFCAEFCLNKFSNSSFTLALNCSSEVTSPAGKILSKNSWFKSDSSKRLMFLTVNVNLVTSKFSASSCVMPKKRAISSGLNAFLTSIFTVSSFFKPINDFLILVSFTNSKRIDVVLLIPSSFSWLNVAYNTSSSSETSGLVILP